MLMSILNQTERHQSAFCNVIFKYIGISFYIASLYSKLMYCNTIFVPTVNLLNGETGDRRQGTQ